MAQARRSALRVISRKQLKGAQPLTRFLWLRAYRVMRVCAGAEDTQQRVTSNLNEVFEASYHLARISNRNTFDVFQALFRAAYGHDYDGSFEITLVIDQ